LMKGWLEDGIRTPLHLVLASDWLLMEKPTFYNTIYMYTDLKEALQSLDRLCGWVGSGGVAAVRGWRCESTLCVSGGCKQNSNASVETDGKQTIAFSRRLTTGSV
jgi:hypothetical protein